MPIGRLIDAPPPLAPAERFARHLAREFEAVFLFLRDPPLDATNWRAEHAIRPAVVTRKVCGGNRTRRGADTQILASVVRTARQRQLDPRALFTTMLCASEPVVPEALALPPTQDLLASVSQKTPRAGGRSGADLHNFQAISITNRSCRPHPATCGRRSARKSTRIPGAQAWGSVAVLRRVQRQPDFQGNRPLKRRRVVVCVPASAESTRCDAGWRPAPTAQPFAQSRRRHDCAPGRGPDAPTR